MMPADAATALERQVRALGNSFTPAANEATRAIYRDQIDLSVAGEERHDIAYGDHARHRLDLYRPRGNALGTVVFVHGGGFVGGDKNQDGVFYVNVGRWLARHGWTVVIPTYRLAPDHPWPAGARDLALVMQWVHAQANDLATQAGPVVVWGQSAGASHVASWLFDAAARGDGCSAMASAAMFMSGYYQATAPLAGGPKLYFGDDESLYAARSPLTHVAPVTMPLWLSVAELDPAVIAEHTWALARAVTLANRCNPDFHFFSGHNHVSTVQSLGSPQTDVGAEVLRFLACVAA